MCTIYNMLVINLVKNNYFFIKNTPFSEAYIMNSKLFNFSLIIL
jgi:hypothetical protein